MRTPLDEAVFCQALDRDDGKPLGVIMRYYEGRRSLLQPPAPRRVLDRSGGARCGRASARGGRFMRAMGTPGGRTLFWT